jgi:peptidoglycan/xylan/chitin deacetylase (PgdA/CDA1 family)
MYHDLSGAASGFSDRWAETYKLSENEFAAHLDAIGRAGLGGHIVCVDRAVWDRLPVFLTFDDGGASALRMADMLSTRGWRGHFFVTTGRIGQTGFLSGSGIRELQSHGHIVGSHSVSHPVRMSALSRAQLDEEWKQSVDALQQVLSTPVCTASVPGGFYSRGVGESAADAGIRFLFSSEPVETVSFVADCRLIGRYYIQRGTSAREAAAYASGEWWTCNRQRLLWNSRKILKKALGPAYVKLGKLIR